MHQLLQGCTVSPALGLRQEDRLGFKTKGARESAPYEIYIK